MTAVTRWLNENTAKCPVGRISKAQCEALRKRPSIKEIFSNNGGRGINWGWKDDDNRNTLTRPPECDSCKGWDTYAAFKEEEKEEKEEVVDKKQCTKCGETKGASEFHRDPKAKGGFKNICKNCYNARRRSIGQKLRWLQRENACLKNALGELLATVERAWDDMENNFPDPLEELLDEGVLVERYSSNPNFDALLRRMGRTHDAKRQDYASNQDPLGNFREAERLGVTPLQSIMIRLTDKYTRACNLVRRNGSAAVRNESLEDTLLDMANYSLLALLAHKENQGDTPGTH